jgi:hypothetical protein
MVSLQIEDGFESIELDMGLAFEPRLRYYLLTLPLRDKTTLILYGPLQSYIFLDGLPCFYLRF